MAQGKAMSNNLLEKWGRNKQILLGLTKNQLLKQAYPQ